MKHCLNHRLLGFLASGCTALLFTPALRAEEDTWWNKEWTQRNTVTVDTSEINGAVGESVLLIRLFDANFPFATASQDGSDIRVVASDGKTVLPHQIESYDNLLNEAYLWVKVPDLKGGAKQSLYIYSGNQAPTAAEKVADVFGENVSAVYHFAERGGAPADATSHGNKAETVATPADGSIIGNGLRLTGSAPVSIPSSPSLAWTAGRSLGVSLWVKPTALQPNAVIFSRSEGDRSFRLLLDQGVPMVEIKDGGTIVRSQAGNPVASGTWNHLAVSAENGGLSLYLNGEPYASASGTIPALEAPIVLGGADAQGTSAAAFAGDLDELRISKAALSAGDVKLASINQGTSASAQKFLTLGAVEGGEEGGHSKVLEHLSLFGDIANNMMFDGWMAIGVCMIMIGAGWTVAIRKFVYLNRIEKGNAEFLRQWHKMSSDLTSLDHHDESSVKSMGGAAAAEAQAQMEGSPLYHIYHIGSGEIRQRLNKLSDKIDGLPGRSIQAIRACLDTGLVHENHRLTKGLVFLTMSIAGGPYVGLLGTVVGVMITFAIIAKSGEVNVNSIAPGIASALLATVVGLIVAIPALFIYSYLNSRIKNVVASMQVFIDEFVAKTAEFHRPKNEV
jgi:biopolymer transport protein ExbB